MGSNRRLKEGAPRPDQTVALPHEELKQALRKYGRLVEPK